MRFVFFYSTFYILVAILDCPNNIIPWIHWLRQKSIIRQKGLKFDPNSQYSSYGIQWLELGASNLGQPKINKKSYHLLFIKDYYTSTTTYTAKKKWSRVQAPDAAFMWSWQILCWHKSFLTNENKLFRIWRTDCHFLV